MFKKILDIFQKKSLGINISDSSIEVLEASRAGDKVRILHLARTTLASGIIERGIIKDKERLSQALMETLKKAGITIGHTHEAAFGLPEVCFYVHTFKVRSENVNQEFILKEARANIPLDPNKLIYVYSIINKISNNEEKTILVVGADKDILTDWQRFFADLKIEVNLFDLEISAVRRALNLDNLDNLCLVDLGANTSSISIFIDDDLYYSYASEIAGKSITQKISENLKIDWDKAERTKIKADILNKKSRTAAIIREELKKIVLEINNLISYFQEKTGRQVSKVVLCGGTSKLKNISEFFAGHLSTSRVELSQPIKFNKKISPEFIGALGLALLALDKNRFSGQPHFEISMGSEQYKFLHVLRKSKANLLRLFSPKSYFLISILVVALIVILVGVIWRTRQRDLSSPSQEINKVNKISSSTQEHASEETLEIKEKVKEKTEVPHPKYYIQIVNTKGKRVNIRKGPGINFKIIGKASEGDKYEFVTEEDDWIKIILPTGEEGWVYSALATHL